MRAGLHPPGGGNSVIGTELGKTKFLGTTGTNHTITTSKADVVGGTVSVTVPTGCEIDVYAALRYVGNNNAAVKWVGFYLYEDGVEVATTLKGFGASTFDNIHLLESRAPAAGGHVYKVQAIAELATFTAYGLTGQSTGIIKVNAR